MAKVFYFHDVLQTQNLSSIQKGELEKKSYFELFKEALDPFEKTKGIKVVLLVVAEGISKHPDVVEYIKRHAHWRIGCHGLHHEDYSKKGYEETLKDLSLAQEKIEKTFYKPVSIFVPPWKKYNKDTERVCKELGMKIDLDKFFSIKHLNVKKIANYDRLDIHYWWSSDRKKINQLGIGKTTDYSDNCNFSGVNIKHGKETPEFWDKIWRNHRAGERKHAKLYVELKKYLNGKILDLACGITPLYNNEPYDVVGVDLSPKAMNLMKERCPTGKFIVQDIREADFPAETFDTILLSSAIEHFENFDPLLINSKRFLKKGGTIVVVVPEKHHFRTHVHCEWGEKKIKREIGSILENIHYYKIKLPHGYEWIIVYKKK